MSLPSVGQARMLADQLALLIERHTPSSVAIIGCAGGNGLDRIDSSRVERIVAVDINPEYIAAAELRPGGTLAVLLQLPHADQHTVSDSPYKSLNKLMPALKLVAPDELCSHATAAGFSVGNSDRIDLPSGKQFWLQTFQCG